MTGLLAPAAEISIEIKQSKAMMEMRAIHAPLPLKMLPRT